MYVCVCAYLLTGLLLTDGTANDDGAKALNVLVPTVRTDIRIFRNEQVDNIEFFILRNIIDGMIESGVVLHDSMVSISD